MVDAAYGSYSIMILTNVNQISQNDILKGLFLGFLSSQYHIMTVYDVPNTYVLSQCFPYYAPSYAIYHTHHTNYAKVNPAYQGITETQ